MKNRKNRIQKIRTVRDARIEKLRADAIRFPETNPVIVTDPRIGQLCRKGKTVFYTSYIDGTYTEGTLADLTSKLGARS